MNKLKFVILLLVIAATIFTAAWAFTNRTFLSKSGTATNVNIKLVSVAFDSSHVAIEYTVDGQIQTTYGNYTDCPVGKSQVMDARGQDVSGQVFTSCRPASNGQFEVTQFFYNDFSLSAPKTVNIHIGDLVFYPKEGGPEIQVPALKIVPFSLPSMMDNNISFTSPETVKVSSGLEMTIQRADFTPRALKADACILLPDAGDWGISASVKMGDQAFPIDYWQVKNFREAGVLSNSRRCFTMFSSGLSDFHNFKPGQISITVDKVYRNMPDCVNQNDFAKIKDELQKYGVALHPQFDAAGYYCFTGDIVNSTSPDVNAHLFGYIREALKEEVEGPLTITIR